MRGCAMWSCSPLHQPGAPTSTLPSPPPRQHPPRTGRRCWGGGTEWLPPPGGSGGSGAAGRGTRGPSPAEGAAGGSVSPGFIGIIVIIIIFIIILVEFPDAGSSGAPAITEAALGFLFTYLFYSGGALPDFSRQPWPGGRGGEEAAPVGHSSDMPSLSPLFPTLPFPTQSGVPGWGTPVPAAPWPQAHVHGRAGAPKPLAEWLLALVLRGIGAMQWHLAGQLVWTPPCSPAAPVGGVWGVSSLCHPEWGWK